LDANKDGFIDLHELKDALNQVGFKLAGYQVREMIDEYKGKGKQTAFQGKLNLEEFEALCLDLKSKDVASTFKTVVSKKENLETLGGMSSISSEGGALECGRVFGYRRGHWNAAVCLAIGFD